MSHLLLLCSIIIMFPSGRCPPTDHYFHNNNNNTTTTNTSKYYLLFPTPRCLRQLQQPGQALSVPPPAPWPGKGVVMGRGGARGTLPSRPLSALSPRLPARPPPDAPERRKRRPLPPPPRHKVTPLCLHVPGGRAPPTAHGGGPGGGGGRAKEELRIHRCVPRCLFLSFLAGRAASGHGRSF